MKLAKNVRDLGKLIVAKGFKNLPKVQKLPNLVTLNATHTQYTFKLSHSTWVVGR